MCLPGCWGVARHLRDHLVNSSLPLVAHFSACFLPAVRLSCFYEEHLFPGNPFLCRHQEDCQQEIPGHRYREQVASSCRLRLVGVDEVVKRWEKESNLNQGRPSRPSPEIRPW